MDQIVALLIGLVVGLLLGAFGFRLVVRARGTETAGAHPAVIEAQHSAELTQVRADEAGRRAELGSRLASIEATEAGLRERVRDLDEQLGEITARYDAERAELVGRHDAERSDLVRRHDADRAQLVKRHDDERTERDERERLERSAREERDRVESKVLQALAPVKETLQSMQSKVTELESQRHLQHGELSQQLKSAAESEERLRSTADSLAAALKNNSTRGVWGETQLRAVVEAAGLLQRVNFDVQSSIVSDRGAGRPDMVVNLPGGKCIAVDAKVPFNSYIEANAIPLTADDALLGQRAGLIKKHVKAVRDHITTLGGKAYWEGLDASPEMVIAFIPSESLLSSALEADPTIMEFAFAKRVALASPVTLFSVLKTVAVSWQHSAVTEEAKSLFDTSRELYSRLTTMAQHIDKLGRSVKTTVNDYNKFVGSLERQVLPSARRLNTMDESKVIGTLAVIEETTRELTAAELTAELSEEATTVAALAAPDAASPGAEKTASIDRELKALDETGVRPTSPARFGLTLPGLDDTAKTTEKSA